MGASTNHSRDMLRILESYVSQNGENGVNPGVQEDMEPLAAALPHSGQENSVTSTPNVAASAAASAPTIGLANLPDKPKRPLSAYNIFFQHEREKIVSNAPDKPVTLESLKVDSRRKVKKRRHRKSHGKIGFADLARTIADKWKTLDPETRAVFDSCAAKEKERYKRELKEWKAVKKSLVAAEQEAAKKKAQERADMRYDATNRNRMNGGVANLDLHASLRSAGASGFASRAMMGREDMMMGNGRDLRGQSTSMEDIQDPREYLKITQQVIDMARASLSLPLFANLGSAPTMEDTLNATSFPREQHPSSFRMNRNPTSSFLYSSNDMELSRFSNSGALLNVPFRTDMSSLDRDSHQLYQSQLLRALDSNPLHASQLRDELESRALNRRMQYQADMQYHQHAAELDAGASSNHHHAQDAYSRLGQVTRHHGYDVGAGSMKPQSHRRPGDQDDLVNLVNAAQRDSF